MAMSAGRDDGQPMMDMNTTPLIDVMLVLLIMFIITIPPQTHAVKVDLPQSNNPPPVNINPISNEVTISPTDVVAWNGTPINLVQLAQFLDQTKTMNPQPELHFKPDPQSRYEMTDKALAVVKRSAVEKLGFIGNDQYYTRF